MQDFESFNIRQMQVYAGLCLQRFCSHHRIDDPLIDELIVHLLEILVATDLSSWEHDGTYLAITGRGDPIPEVVSNSLSRDTLSNLRSLMESCVEVGMVDMYGEPTRKPLEFLETCISKLTRSGIPLPAFQPLKKHKKGTDHWGDSISKSDFEELLRAYELALRNA